MKCLLFLIVFPLGIWAQDSTAKIDERLLYTVVSIENHNTNSQNFEEGTGFIVSVPSNNNFFIYLVTNKHVICNNYNAFDSIILSDSIFVHFYSSIDRFKDIIYQVKLKDSKNQILPTIKLHSNPFVDVAVIDVTNIFIEHGDIYPYSLDTSLLAHYADVKNIGVGLGSQVFALGYPAAQKLSNGNLPIGKVGYISSSLSGRTEYDMYFLDRTKKIKKLTLKGKFFIVDGLLIPGNSGSPIINPKEVKTYFGKDYPVKQQHINNFIIGILSSGIQQYGLSVCYSSDYFLELIRDFKR